MSSTTTSTTTTTAAAASQPVLSFPPATYKKIDPTSYLLRHLEPDSHSSAPTRPSGRAPHEFRTPTLHTSSLSNAHGSAVVRTGDTAVVCGVRGEILTLRTGEKKVVRSGVDEDDDGGLSRGKAAREALRSYPLLVPNLELNTGCSAQYHPGPPSDYAQAMTQRLKHLLLEVTEVVDGEELKIVYTSREEDGDGDGAGQEKEEIKAYWVLYVDVLVISLDGNIMDAAWGAIMAALRDTKLPVARWDHDHERVLCDPVEKRELALGKELPFSASFGVFAPPVRDGSTQNETEARRKNIKNKLWVLADLDDFEEGVCEEKILIVIRDGKGTMARVEKGGGKALGVGGGALGGIKEVKECAELAAERWKVWSELIRDKT